MGMDPATIMLASAGVQAVGGMIGGKQQDKQAKKEAAATLADAQLRAAETVDSAKRYSQQQEVGFLKSGVDLSGSPLMVMQDTLRQGARNASNIMAGAQSSADTLRERGSTALMQGVFGGISDLVGGYTKAKSYTQRYGTPDSGLGSAG